MDTTAMLVGYATMFIGGVGLLLAAAWFAADVLFRIWHHCWNMGDLLDAAQAAEREECAKVADRHSTCINDTPNVIATTIRARELAK